MPIKSEFPPVFVDERPFSVQFIEKVRLNAAKNPNKPALINAHDASEKVTYRQLYLQIQSLARFLSEHEFGHQDVACIVSQNCWEYVTAFGATIMCGGALSGASYLFTEAEIRRQFLDNGASVVFCGEKLLECIQKAATKCPKVKLIIVIGSDPSTKFPQQNVYSFAEALRAEPHFESKIKYNVHKDILLIPYSSGTTGIPKGVMLTHYNLSATIAAITAYYRKNIWPKLGTSGEPDDQCLLMIMPFYHVYGQSLIIYGIMSNMVNVIMKAFEPELFCASIQKYKIKLLKAVPPMILFLAKSPMVEKYDLSSLVAIASGAAPLGPDICEEVQRRLPHLKYVVQGFGMSEMSVASHFPFLSGNSSCCGKLIPNMEMKIVCEENGEEKKRGERGELCVKGPNVMLGYLNRPEETAKIIDSDGWLHTGDVGYLGSDNCLYIVDRLKELIKVKGLQVAPAELEDLLLSHPCVADCAIIGVPDDRMGEVPKAFVVRRDENLTETQVYDYLAHKVADYKNLRGGVQFVSEIPRSLAGKILRRELRDSNSMKARL